MHIHSHIGLKIFCIERVEFHLAPDLVWGVLRGVVNRKFFAFLGLHAIVYVAEIPVILLFEIYKRLRNGVRMFGDNTPPVQSFLEFFKLPRSFSRVYLRWCLHENFVVDQVVAWLIQGKLLEKCFNIIVLIVAEVRTLVVSNFVFLFLKVVRRNSQPGILLYFKLGEQLFIQIGHYAELHYSHVTSKRKAKATASFRKIKGTSSSSLMNSIILGEYLGSRNSSYYSLLLMTLKKFGTSLFTNSYKSL